MADMFDAKIALFHKHADSRDEALKMLADEFMKSGVHDRGGKRVGDRCSYEIITVHVYSSVNVVCRESRATGTHSSLRNV